jgi:hypothetical protein
VQDIFDLIDAVLSPEPLRGLAGAALAMPAYVSVSSDWVIRIPSFHPYQ